MEILIIGTGYVGLVTGACFSEMGFRVTCLDINREKITLLNRGIIPIYEPGLEDIVKRCSQAGRLTFTTDYKASCEKANVIFLAVDTPISETGAADLKQIKAVAGSLASYINDYKVIVNKSTVPVGTSGFVKKIIKEGLEKRGVTIPFDMVSNPEFLKEGSAVSDFLKPDRVVIGCESNKAKEIMATLYKPFMLSNDRLYFMDIASAEMTKYAANAMLATRISFMNQLSILCEKTGADIGEVRKGIGSDKRIGWNFLWAGCGFGGSCFPKDLKALESMFLQEKLSPSLVKAVIDINEAQKEVLFHKISDYFSALGGLKGKTVGILGLAFKPDTDDMRQAPSSVLIKKLLSEGVTVHVYDPVAMENAKNELPKSDRIIWCRDELETAQNCDALVIVTEWKQFRCLDFKAIRSVMRHGAFFDGRNQYDALEVAQFGFDVFSIGKKPVYHALQKEFFELLQEERVNAPISN